VYQLTAPEWKRNEPFEFECLTGTFRSVPIPTPPAEIIMKIISPLAGI